MTAAPADALACPLCGGPNACGPARGTGFAEPCWCESVTFDASVLARVPDALRGVSCICADCAGAASARPGQTRDAS